MMIGNLSGVKGIKALILPSTPINAVLCSVSTFSFSVLGKVLSAVGSAQLLMSQKFQQFRGLCEQNLVSVTLPPPPWAFQTLPSCQISPSKPLCSPP